MASGLYLEGMAQAWEGTLDWDAAGTTIKVALVTSSYTYNPDHNFFDDITNELSGTGYTAGGVAIGSKAVSRDTTNDRIELDAADAAWTALNAGTIAAAIIYKDTGVAGTSPLIAFIDLTDTVTNGGNITIEWNAEGIINFPA